MMIWRHPRCSARGPPSAPPPIPTPTSTSLLGRRCPATAASTSKDFWRDESVLIVDRGAARRPEVTASASFYWINRGYNLEGGKEKSRRFRILSWTCCQESKCPGLWRGNGGKTKIDWRFESKNMYGTSGVVSPLFAAVLWKHHNLHVSHVTRLKWGLSPRTVTLCYVIFFSYFTFIHVFIPLYTIVWNMSYLLFLH